MTTFHDVAAFIGQASQTEVDTIFGLCNNRTKLLRQIASTENLGSLKPGDKVRIISGISPKYLIGATGTVGGQAARAGSLSITLDRQVGKFGTYSPIGVPASCLQKVES